MRSHCRLIRRVATPAGESSEQIYTCDEHWLKQGRRRGASLGGATLVGRSGEEGRRWPRSRETEGSCHNAPLRLPEFSRGKNHDDQSPSDHGSSRGGRAGHRGSWVPSSGELSVRATPASPSGSGFLIRTAGMPRAAW